MVSSLPELFRRPRATKHWAKKHNNFNGMTLGEIRTSIGVPIVHFQPQDHRRMDDASLIHWPIAATSSGATVTIGDPQ
jgi:hypothetical protein